MTALTVLTDFLDRRLRVGAFRDDSHNGLQVENSGRLVRVCAGVDASLAFFQAAARQGAGLLLCHHGLSWGDSLKRITGLNYRRLKFLLDHDMALYACHLPLDAHPRLGNNALLADTLGLRRRTPFGVYHGMTLGVRGELPRALPYPAFKARVERRVGRLVAAMEFGPRQVRTVGVISGGAADLVAQAGADGLDAFLSGEPQLQAWSLAQEHGVHALFAGHYATERFGVQALARLVAQRLGVPAAFVDLGVPV